MFSLVYERGLPELKITDDDLTPDLYGVPGIQGNKRRKIAYLPLFAPFCFPVENYLKALRKPLPADAAAVVRAEEKHLALLQKKQLPINLPDDFFVYKPYKHQWLALCLGAAFPRCAWFYDMGLGKTKIAIDTHRINVLRFGKNWRTLIVTPPATIDNWCEEIELHGKGEIAYGKFLGPKKERALRATASGGIILTSYATMRIHWEVLHAQAPAHCIFDEAHNLRSPGSQQSKSALSLVSVIPRRTLMTGSAMTDPRHMFIPLKVLHPALVPERNMTNYLKKFCKQAPNNHHIILGYKNLDTLRGRINSVGITRKKENCLDLPDRVVINVKVPMGKKSKRVYNDLVRNFKTKLDGRVVELPTETGASQVTSLMQVSRGWLNESQRDPTICDTCPLMKRCIREGINPYTSACDHSLVNWGAEEPRLELARRWKRLNVPAPITHVLEDNNPFYEALVERVNGIIEGDNKVIVWFRSTRVLLRTQNLLKKGVSVVVRGGTKYGQVINQFNNDPKKKVLLGQVQCGIGWNATAANYVIYAEPTLVPDQYEQSRDRNYRPGQTRKVTVYRMCVEGSLDEGVFSGVDAGINVGRAVCDATFCKQCEANGSCLLNFSKNPGKSKCALKGFVQRSKLKIKEVELEVEEVEEAEETEEFDEENYLEKESFI